MSAEDRNGMAVGLTCKDMQKSVAFYRDTLGFHMKESWPDEKAPMWCNMVLDGQSVMLGASMDPDAVEQMCSNDPADAKIYRGVAEKFRQHPAGVGVNFYLQVEDVDSYDKRIRGKGVKPLRNEPKTQFYGIRETLVDDPDGYRLVFYTAVAMSSCQSCGMPLTDAKPGQMYCDYCTDESGKLRPYEQVFEGTVTGYFMGMQKMDRKSAERAAKAHLSKMPAWAAR